DDVRARIAGLIASLRPAVRGVRWLSPETVHITLRFLGDGAPESVERVRHRLRTAAAACAGGEVVLSGLGVFPERGAPRVLWLGAEMAAPLVQLQRECEEAARACGYA